ncbi:hypothetical protein LX16_3066 [Stackebrandtia albiflava]|uniref:Zn-dependent protease with chaperone function n=1 Tax=Stackebrandtia albiflava TaxID=406432 RepID=A0A562V339_9ACTN|nr:hypothetical protein [Stackebrandtia albiflava]TWJ12310.1 hypothetical protein LX16_3066 [Stackebrandtia albiflava]
MTSRAPSRGRTLLDALLVVGVTWGALVVLCVAGLAAAAVAGGLVWWAAASPSALPATGGLVLLGVPVALWVAADMWLGVVLVYQGLRVDRPFGYSLSYEAAPGLWAMVWEAAAALDVPPPAEIRVTPMLNLGLDSPPRSVGRPVGIDRLYIGMPVLAMATPADLRALLAREFAFFAGTEGRLRREAFRFRLRSLSRRAAERRGPAALLVRWWIEVRRWALSTTSLRTKRSADRAAAGIVGAVAIRHALWSIALWSAAWEEFVAGRLSADQSEVVAPRRTYAAFTDFAVARLEYFGRRVTEGMVPGLWTDAEELGTRFAALAAEADMPPDAPVPPTGATGLPMITDFDALASVLEPKLFTLGRTELLDWPDYLEAVTARPRRRVAEAAYRGLTAVAGPDAARLSFVLDEVAAGRGAMLFRALNTAGMPTAWFAEMIWVAAFDSGVLDIREDDDTGEVAVFDRDGKFFHARRIADLLSPAPESAVEVRAALEKLGVDLALAHGNPYDAADPVPCSGIVAVDVNGVVGDLVITDVGLLFLAGTGPGAEGAHDRLATVLSRYPIRSLMERSAAWLPWSEVFRASVSGPSVWWELTTRSRYRVKESPRRVRITTSDMRTHVIRWTDRTESLPAALDFLTHGLGLDH